MIARGGDNMKEEGKKPNSKNFSWKKLVRKKWFYPAVYLTFAALILAAVIWYQNRALDLPEDTLTNNDDVTETTNEVDDTIPVVNQQEVLKMPVADGAEAEIVTKFFDYDASQEDREQALIVYNNKVYQSVGVDIASTTDETFDVTAALSGTVTEVKEDPLQGMVVELTHDDGITTKYASLENVTVSSGDKVTQGDVLGSAGKNLFGQANGVHVHFELRKDDTPLNPEDFFNKTIGDIQMPDEGDDEADKESNAEVDENVTSDEDATSEDASDENTDMQEEQPTEGEGNDDDSDDDDNEDDNESSN